jgi:hypothetical protein
MRGTDWSRTSLGPAALWPQSLKTSVSICLDSGFPVLLWWGPEECYFTFTYSPIRDESGGVGRPPWT